jgi:hypothetical protein
MLKKAVKLVLFSTILATGICYAGPGLPEVDVSTGLVTNGPLEVNQSFVFVNRTNTACAVSTPSDPNDQWFTPTPISVPAASNGNTGTYTVTAAIAGTWTYLSSCLQGAEAHIQVGSS